MENTPVVITWSFTNWVTISLMALITFMLFGLAANGIVRYKQNKTAQ